jgi:flagellar biosynthesis/type III secretory pathway M-ring protein FliF/YscJ
VPVIPNTKSSQSQSSHLSIGLIIGIAVASVVILAAIIGMSIIKIRRRRARAAARPAQFTGDPDVQKYLLTPQETGGNEIFEMGQYTQSHEMMPDKETMKKMAFELEGDQTRRKTPEPAG